MNRSQHSLSIRRLLLIVVLAHFLGLWRRRSVFVITGSVASQPPPPPMRRISRSPVVQPTAPQAHGIVTYAMQCNRSQWRWRKDCTADELSFNLKQFPDPLTTSPRRFLLPCLSPCRLILPLIKYLDLGRQSGALMESPTVNLRHFIKYYAFLSHTSATIRPSLRTVELIQGDPNLWIDLPQRFHSSALSLVLVLVLALVLAYVCVHVILKFLHPRGRHDLQ